MTSKNIFFTIGFWVELPLDSGFGFFCVAVGRGGGVQRSPARKWSTPVTSTALVWCASTPKDPTSADEPRMMMQTSAQEMDRFCIPGGEGKRREGEG